VWTFCGAAARRRLDVLVDVALRLLACGDKLGTEVGLGAGECGASQT
jgi:hypothetical protein